MAYKITEDCISCGACESECPNKAISEGKTNLVHLPQEMHQCAGEVAQTASGGNPENLTTSTEIE